MKRNLKIVKIDKNKSLFNYEKKVLIKELILNLKLGYFDFEKEAPQKVKFNLEVNYEDKKLFIFVVYLQIKFNFLGRLFFKIKITKF